MVLIFLQIFSSLSVCELLALSASWRVDYHRWIRKKYALIAIQALSDIERGILNGNNKCVVPVMAASDLKMQPMAWWQAKTCYWDALTLQYYYAVERLGADPCGVINIDNNHNVSVEYYRITLYMIIPNMKTAKLIFQSTLAKPTNEHLSCVGMAHQVLPGRQTLREL